MMRRNAQRVSMLAMVAVVLLLGAQVTTAQSGNLIRNSGFELDANLDGRPDDWLPATGQFTRSQATVTSGAFSGRYFLNRASSSQVSQRVTGIAAGYSYVFKGKFNIDAAPGTRFSFDIEFQWRSGSGAVIGTTLVRGGGETKAWIEKRAAIRAPAGAADLLIVMRVKQLNAGSLTVFVDDFALVRV